MRTIPGANDIYRDRTARSRSCGYGRRWPAGTYDICARSRLSHESRDRDLLAPEATRPPRSRSWLRPWVDLSNTAISATRGAGPPGGREGGDNQHPTLALARAPRARRTSRRRRSWVHCEHGAICLLPAGVVAAAREPHACWSRESPEAQDQEALSDNGLPLPRRAKQHGQSQPVASMPRPSRWACRRSVGACRRACAV